MKRKLLILLLSCPFVGSAQIDVNYAQVDDVISDFFVGQGVFISNLTFNGLPFDTTYSQVGYFVSGTSGFPLDMGIIMATGNVVVAEGPNTMASATNNSGVAPDPNDPDLAAIASAPMNNEAVLEFDFIPAGDTVKFNYIFASEEYPEYSPSVFNDVFGFFISGPGFAGPYTNGAVNIAQLPSPAIPVTINNVNPTTNPAYYISNAGGTATQFDGYTVTLTAIAAVQCGETYHIKLAIADAGDQAYESGVFLEGSSFISNGLGVSFGGDDAFAFLDTEITEGCDSLGLFLQLPDWAVGSSPTVNITTGGNAILNSDYIISDTTISFAPGDTIVPFFIQALGDSMTELDDSIILTINFLTPCGDTVGIDKVIYLVDLIPASVTLADTVVFCPGQPVLLDPMIVGGGSSIQTIWSNGDTTATLNLAVYSDSTVIVQVFTGCGPAVSDTVFIDLLSNLGGSVSGPVICYDDPTASMFFTGIADSLSWGNDTLVVPNSGIYFYDLYIYDTTYGCVDSMVYQLYLYPVPEFPYIYNLSGTLVADTNVAYQWYFNGLPIAGATSIDYIAPDTGYYQVEVWDTNGCSIFSDSVYVSSLLAFDEISSEYHGFTIYPNPASGFVMLEFSDENQNSEVVIQNLAGQIVFRQRTTGVKKLQLNLEDFAAGSYVVSFISDGYLETQRLVIY